MIEVKTFRDLQKEIITPKICSLCGGCVSICSITNTNAIKIINEIPQLIEPDKDLCIECGLCYQICPRTSNLSKKIDELYDSEGIGSYKKLTWAKTNDPEIIKSCQDGGVVTSLIKYLLDNKQVDGAIVNMAISDWQSSPVIVTSSEQLLKSVGTRYSINPSLELFQNPKIYSSPNKIQDISLSSIISLMDLHKFDYTRLAFVGCPCHVAAIRKMQVMNIRPASVIKFVIGLFCMENFTYDELMKKQIEKRLKIKLEDIQKVNIKKNFIITLKDNSVIEVPFKDIERSVRPNCLFCPDFSNVLADISIGGIGAPQKNSTVLIRSKKGENLFENALSAGYLTEYKEPEVNFAQLRTKTLKLIQRMTNIKKERAEKNLQQCQI